MGICEVYLGIRFCSSHMELKYVASVPVPRDQRSGHCIQAGFGGVFNLERLAASLPDCSALPPSPFI